MPRSVAPRETPAASRIAPRPAGVARSYATLDFTIVPFSLAIAAFTIGVVPYIALLPIVANTTLHADARGFGFLSACGGIGAIVGAVVLSTIGETARKGRAVPLAMLAGAGLLVAFAFATNVGVAGALLAALGAVDTLMYALSNTYVQERARDEDRGRANGVFSLAYLGGIPIGNVALGALAARIGTGPALASGAGVAALAAVAFWILAPRAREAA
jgi:predicted MFS family arabinose efflux permease